MRVEDVNKELYAYVRKKIEHEKRYVNINEFCSRELTIDMCTKTIITRLENKWHDINIEYDKRPDEFIRLVNITFVKYRDYIRYLINWVSGGSGSMRVADYRISDGSDDDDDDDDDDWDDDDDEEWEKEFALLSDFLTGVFGEHKLEEMKGNEPDTKNIVEKYYNANKEGKLDEALDTLAEDINKFNN